MEKVVRFKPNLQAFVVLIETGNFMANKKNNKSLYKQSNIKIDTIKSMFLNYLFATIENLLLLNDYERILNDIKDYFDLDYINIVDCSEFIENNYIFKELNSLRNFENEISLNEKDYLFLGNSFYNKKIYNISNFFFNLGALINPKEFLYKQALTTYYKEHYIFNEYNLMFKFMLNTKRKKVINLLKKAEKITDNKEDIYLLFCSIYLNMKNMKLYHKYINKLKNMNNFNLSNPQYFNLNLSIMNKNDATKTDFERLLSDDEKQNKLIYFNILETALSHNNKKDIDIYYPKYLNCVLNEPEDNLCSLFFITTYVEEQYFIDDIFLNEIKQAFIRRFRKLYTEYNLCLKNNLREISQLYEEYIIKWFFYFTQILKNSSNNLFLKKIKQDEDLKKILYVLLKIRGN